MSQPFPALPDEPPVLPATWGGIWRTVLTEPSADTLSRLAQAPEASARRAHLWVFLSVLAGSLLAGIISWVIQVAVTGGPAGPTPLDLVFLSPLVALVGLAVFVIGMNLLQLVSHALGGKGNYARLAYAGACGLAPLLLIMLPLGAIPIVAASDALLAVYALFLLLLAVRAATGLEWTRSALSLALALAVLAALGGCFVIAVVPFLPLRSPSG